MTVETDILFFGQHVQSVCDGDCAHAWGRNGRRSGDTAPEDPGTYEGGDGKPKPPYPPAHHNKWCVRECERCHIREEKT
jgi:hypothetical protein